jgi:2-oxoglutarate dehydrogenase E1 component
MDSRSISGVSMSFLDNVSPRWIEEQYRIWKQSSDRLPPEWKIFFSGFEAGLDSASSGEETASPEFSRKLAAVQALIHRHRDLGHLLACTDPLSPCMTEHPLLDLHAFGLDDSDLGVTFPVEEFPGGEATLREILTLVRETYCRSIGVEFMHIQDPEKWLWLTQRMESRRNRTIFSPEEKLSILRKLREASLFETFLHRKFPGQTRFSLEGGETLITLLDTVVRHGSRTGTTDVILGMPHRGRLNIMAHIFGKPYENIFAEFRDECDPGFVGDGDVKYHAGFSTNVTPDSGAPIHLTLAANPSHLEAVNPVVEGKSRARQDRFGTDGTARVLPVLIHGDAAFSGQGMVAETLNLAGLEGYRTGGTLHIVLNNQIGFTTGPSDARSSRYATDTAKMLAAPIFHIHSEDPEAAVHAMRLALDFRREFGCDVVVELICYRRHGHNEGDEPWFTQPLLYAAIKDRPPVHESYGERLREEGIPGDAFEGMTQDINERLETAFAREPSAPAPAFHGRWSEIRREYAPAKVETGTARKTISSLAHTLSELPPGFTPHPKIAALLRKRNEAVSSGAGVDWANAESLAFASLLREGVSVRLSGQDSRRGTFSQRHAVLHDIITDRTYIPLSSVAAKNATFFPCDSPLSEAAVLGFEYGYSLESPQGLTLWEAQYGDFSNGAQVIIDQFLTSGETKWGRASGLVLLLPHGYEGHGAEHSSARLERFLQLSADANMLVTFPSTPSQYFHLLRRQVKQPFRKPLVVLTPKSLLRHHLCVSRLDEITGGWFREVLPSSADPEKVSAVLICSGKLYFDLAARRQREEREDVAIVRVEQLFPLRDDLLREELGRFRHARSFTWTQEEPRNMGAWSYIRPHLAAILDGEPKYAGRREAACPAVGSHRQHGIEQEKILDEAFAPDP